MFGPTTTESSYSQIADEKSTTSYSITNKKPSVSRGFFNVEFSPYTVDTCNVKSTKLPHPLSRLYSAYTRWPVSSYLHLAVLVLFVSMLGIFGYQQFFRDAEQKLAFPTSLTRPNRILSFQGRLTDTAGTPLTVATNFTFKLYDALTSGNQLWTSGTCSITPDQDGIFSTLLGSSCGSEIASGVFSENQNVYLEVTVAAETLTPRQQIATVGYALNAETLQGYPASASAVENTVLVMNNSGQVLLGNASPTLRSTSGTFAVQGNALNVSTNTGTGGNITLAPDGAGQVSLIGGTTTQDFIDITNANLTTGKLMKGTVGNNNTGYKFLSFVGGSTPSEKFYVNALGGVYAGNSLFAPVATISATNTSATPLIINGTGGQIFSIANGGNIVGAGTLTGLTGLTSSGTITFSGLNTAGAVAYTQSGGVLGVTAQGVSGYLLGSGGAGTPTWIDPATVGSNYWQLTNKVISPGNSTHDLAVGGNATSSALFQVFGNTGNATTAGTLTFNGAAYSNNVIAATKMSGLQIGNSSTGNIIFNGGKIGVGTANPQGTLHVASSANIDDLVVNTEATTNNIVDSSFETGLGGWYATSVNATITQSTTQSYVGSKSLKNVATATNEGAYITMSSGFTAGVLNTFSSYGYLESGTGWHLVFFYYDGSWHAVNSPTITTVGSWVKTSVTVSLPAGTTQIQPRLVSDGTATIYFDGVQLEAKDHASPYADGSLGSGYSWTGTPHASTSIRRAGTVYAYQAINSAGGIGATSGSLYPTLQIDQAGTGALFVASVSGTQKFIIDNTGNVGVGTTNPLNKLNVVADTNVYTSAQSLAGLRVDDGTSDTALLLGVNAAGDATYIQGVQPLISWTNRPILLQPNGGNVGIGNTSPTYKLDVTGSASVSANLMAGGQVQLGRFGANPTGIGAGALYFNTTDSKIYYYDGSSWSQVGSGAGGNNSPWDELNGTIVPKNSTEDVLIGGQATTSAKFAFLNVNTGTPVASFSGNLTLTPATSAIIQTTNMIPLVIGSASTGSIQLSPKASTGLFINGSGNVGIGNTAPTVALDVTGQGKFSSLVTASNALTVTTGLTQALGGLTVSGNSVAASGQNFEAFVTSGTAYVQGYDRGGSAYIPLNIAGSYTKFSNGSVGIGTSGAPAEKLEINAGAAAGGIRLNADTGVDTRLVFYENAVLKAGLTYTTSDATFRLSNAGSDIVTLTSAGKVGVGNTAPDGKFQVTGAAVGKALAILNETGDQNILVASASGVTKFTIARTGNLVATGTLTGLTGLTSSGTITFSSLSDGAAYLSSGVLSSETTLSSSRGGTNANLSAAAQGALPYFSATGIMSALAPSTAGYVLQTNGAGANPSWVEPQTLGTNYWQLNNKVLAPGNITYDLALGGNATSSALFQVFGTSGNATSSGNLIFAGTAATNVIAARRNTGLTLGDNQTGGITVNGLSTGVVINTNGLLASEALLSSTRGGTGANLSAAAQGAVPYFSAAGVMSALAPSTAGYVLQTNGAAQNPSWVAAGGLGTNYWQQNGQVLSPGNTTLDVAVGGTATSSALFQVFGNTGNATTSGTLTFAGTAATNLIAARRLTGLTIGDSATGNITFNNGTAKALFSNGYVGINSATTTERLSIGTGNIILDEGYGLNINDAQAGSISVFKYANATDQLQIGSTTATGMTGGILFQTPSAANPLFIDNGGNVGVNNVSPQYTLDITGSASASANISLGGQLQLGRFGTSPTAIGVGALYYNTQDYSIYYNQNGSWTALSTGAGAASPNYWRLSNGALSPVNDTLDLLVGAITTASAKFSVNATNGNTVITGTLTLPNSNTLTGITNYTQFSNGISLGGATTYNITSAGVSSLNTLDLAGNTITSPGNLQITLGGAATKVIINKDLQVSGQDILGELGLTRITVLDSLTKTSISGHLDVSGTFTTASGNFVSSVADGSSAILYNLDTSSAISNATAKLLSLKNNGTEKLSVDKDGNLWVAGAVLANKGFGIKMYNNSGESATQYSLVVVDSTANSYQSGGVSYPRFTKTNVPYSKAVFGVVLSSSCSGGAICNVVTVGSSNVLVTNAATASRGDYVYTSTTGWQGITSGKQFDGLVGTVTDISNAGSGYVEMVFVHQPFTQEILAREQEITNILVSNFRIQAQNATTRRSLEDGMADAFVSSDGIDAASSSGYYHDANNYLVRLASNSGTTGQSTTTTFNNAQVKNRVDVLTGPQVQSQYNVDVADIYTLGLYKFENNGYDSSKFGNLLTAVGTPVYSTSVYKIGSYSLVASDTHYFKPPVNAFPALPHGGTVEAWIYTTDLTSNVQTVFRSSDGSNESYLQINQAGQIVMKVGSGLSYTSTVAYVSTNVWTHLALTWDGSYWRVFVNGAEVDNAFRTATLPTSTSGNNYIGRMSTTGFALNGYIDEFRVTGRVRSALEIKYDASQYNYSVLTSQVMDIGQAPTAIGPLSWTESLGSYGNVEFETRSSADNVTWEAWKPTTSESQVLAMDSDSGNWS
ncbi:MAG: LamG domain-containing protein, partial [Candidatus Pacebacteria bacterium]|nr:LamG domain-containing protein [Candidatus Paceibacterota bacterium]